MPEAATTTEKLENDGRTRQYSQTSKKKYEEFDSLSENFKTEK
jgi:hypothetical protein